MSTIIDIKSFNDGIVICGTFPDDVVVNTIKSYAQDKVHLVIADPPYGNINNNCAWDKVTTSDVEYAQWMIDWTRKLEELVIANGAVYVWGGIGLPRFRPFYRYLVDVETKTKFTVANHITWSKKRAYGIKHNYLFTREELLYLILGSDPKTPRVFNIPLLDEKRGYSGFNPKYPAKSEFYRRTNVWTDIVEIMRDKLHINQKAPRTLEVPIETHTNPGEVVLDMFAGSGETAVAARKLGRRFVLVEKDPSYFEKIVQRLS